MIKNLFFLIITLQFSTQNIEVDRELRQETIYCEHGLDCTAIDASTINASTCLCLSGTFYKKDNKIKCFSGSGSFAGCQSYFEFYEDTVQTIQVVKFPANAFNTPDEFSYAIKTGKTCTNMDVASVKVLNDQFNWDAIDNDFRIAYAAVVDSYYLRWKDPADVSPMKYVGNLLKINLNCRQNSGETSKTCILGKIVGIKTYTADTLDVCKQDVTTTKTTPVVSTTRKPITKDTSSSGIVSPPKRDESKKSELSITIIVIIACSSVFVIFLIILGFCIWRRKKSNSSKNLRGANSFEKDALDPEEIYASPIDPKDVDNPTYLMQIKPTRPNQKTSKSKEKNNSAYVNTPRGINNYVNTEKRPNISKDSPVYNRLSPYAESVYEDPDEVSKNNGGNQNYVPMERTNGFDDQYVRMEST